MTAEAATVPSELTADQLAATALAAFGYALPGPADPDALAGPFAAVAGWAAAAVVGNAESDDDVPVAGLVAEAYEAFSRAADAEAPWGERPPAFRVAFEAAVRHLFGAALCDPDDLDLEAAEPAWGPWAAARLGEEARDAA